VETRTVTVPSCGSIRRAGARDLEAVLTIERASFTTPWRRPTFVSLLTRSDTDFLVATAPGGVVGYTVVWTMGHESELANVAVSDGARRQGVASALVRAAVSVARDRGSRRVFLEVRESNAGAAALYGRLGFTQVGVRRAYYRKPVEDALVLALPLDGPESVPTG
jgi:ribosomal-protein-alanine N-acetyltransferase